MIDPDHFRHVLGGYPTGICVVAAQDDIGAKHALVVGSFTSISLDPSLVGFYPAKSSSSWPKIEKVGRFSVNVLSVAQVDLCRRFSLSGSDKFANLGHTYTPGGQPLLDNVVAWLDCRLERVVEIGDHLLVVGEVEELGRNAELEPLLFFGGKYRTLHPDTVA